MRVTDDMVERAAIAAANHSMRPGYTGHDWPPYTYNNAPKERWRKIARLMLEAAMPVVRGI